MLKTVRVPGEFAPIFERAQEYVSRYFTERRAEPERGTIEIFGERYLLVRAGAMSVEFFEMVMHLYEDKGQEEALAVARSLLFDIAHAMGRADAKAFAAKMDLTEPIERLSAGPIHFSHTGWAFVDIRPESHPTPDEDYLVVYDHPYSFESDSWIRAKKRPDFPVCIMSAGYSSGWCEESYGFTLVATEILCKAKGDDHCRFIMAQPSHIERFIERYLVAQPAIAPRVGRYEIPGFFSRKRTEEALRESENALRRANEELEQRVALRTNELVEANRRLEADIDERRRTEAELLASRQLNQRIIEALPGGIVHLGPNGEILHANPEAKRFGGTALACFAGGLADGSSAIVKEDGSPADLTDQPAVRALRDGERQGPVTLGLKGGDGAIKWAVLTAVPLMDPLNHDVTGAILTFVDTTEQKQRDEEQRRFESSLQQAQKLESLGVLAGGIAHDFNNILVGVLGNADLAKRRLDRTSPVLPLVDQIELSARRAADLTNQMLAYSGHGHFRIEPVVLSNVVYEMTELLSASVPKNVEVERQLLENLPAIEADVSQLRQVVMNLIINGAEAIGDRAGVVTVATGVETLNVERLEPEQFVGARLQDGPHVYLEVTDTGCGMAPDTLGRIFEPFFTTKFSGRGLGLAATLGIIRGHQAAARIRSTPGRGTSFRIYFRPGARAPSASSPSPPSSDVRRNGTILVVDDEQPVRLVAERALRALGYDVIVAENGEDALVRFEDSAAELSAVLLDLTMPKMDGAETFRRLRQAGATAPVILSSGYKEQDAVARFAEEGFSGFLEKPYTLEQLEEVLDAALRKHRR